LSGKTTPKAEAAPPPLADARRTTEKYSLPFSFCARRIPFSPNEKSIFLWCLALTSNAAGLVSIFSLGRLGIPPLNPPLPSRPRLGRRIFWRRIEFPFLPLPQPSCVRATIMNFPKSSDLYANYSM